MARFVLSFAEDNLNCSFTVKVNKQVDLTLTNPKLVNPVKRTVISVLIVVFSLIVILPAVIPLGLVLAQSNGYSVDRVDHQVQVMYSGNVVILDTIQVSGQVTNGFAIGVPLKYSANVLKAMAYDDTHTFEIALGVQSGDSNQLYGFYGASVDFGGNTPNVFNVAFVLSNRLVTGPDSEGVFTIDFPAYPSLQQAVGTCNVALTFPDSPTSVTVTKEDGNINADSYTRTNLPAFTYLSATASFELPNGIVQLTTISSLDRQIIINPTGEVQVSDIYKIVNNSTSLLNSFVISLPFDATNIVVRDQFGKLNAIVAVSKDGKAKLANATLDTFLATGQSILINSNYNLPKANLEGSNYVLSNFRIFPAFQYYVTSATITFTPPEGATIVSPKASLLDSSTTLTRQTYQDSLTLTKTGLSYIDFVAPQQSVIDFSFNYNPVWVALRPTFWASIAAAIGCVVVLFVRKQKPKEETYADKTERLATLEATKLPSAPKPKVSEQKIMQQISSEEILNFIDAYENRKQLRAELKSMDAKASKGKIPRRQYKIQRKGVENRIDGINRNIKKTKELFLTSTGSLADLIKQLDLAEADLAEAEENIHNLEARQSKGEISIEVYKKNIQDYQRQKDKAESGINGILLRLREKIR